MLIRPASPDSRRLQRLTGITDPDRWERIVADVCASAAERLGLQRALIRAGPIKALVHRQEDEYCPR